MKKTALILAVVVAGCATGSSPQADLTAGFDAMIKSGFEANKIATLDRLKQDDTQALCSDPAAATGAAAAPRRALIEKANLASIKWPSDGKYLGDWKEGEKIAQSGRGLTWTDAAGQPNGGNCYNCHMIDKKEISFGTIGPSLWNYGKLRGVKDIADPASAPIVQYTWGKLWNSKAYSACSNMPRFGHFKLLDEDQIRNIMALLLDPKSPVNQ